jgi:hypothetical protein
MSARLHRRLFGRWPAPALVGPVFRLVLPPSALYFNRAMFGGVHWWQLVYLFCNATRYRYFLNFTLVCFLPRAG